MASELSKEQKRDIEQHGDRPIQIVDPDTQKIYFIIAGELYDRVRPLFDEGFDIRETYAAQDEALTKVWNDPELDVYNDHDVQKPQ